MAPTGQLDQGFGIVVLAEDAAHSLPPAEIRFTIDCSRKHQRKVDRAVIVLGVERGGAVSSHEFDDGKIVVDVDEKDRIRSVEFLSFTAGPVALPELMASIFNHNDVLLWLCVVNTMQNWIELQSYLTLEDEKARARFGEGLHRGWRLGRLSGLSGRGMSAERSARAEVVWS